MDAVIDFKNITLTDALLYAPYALAGAIGLFITWKVGRLVLRGIRLAEQMPARTFGVLGLFLAVVGTPIAVSRLLPHDVGLATGVGGGGFLLAVLSGIALLFRSSDHKVQAWKPWEHAKDFKGRISSLPFESTKDFKVEGTETGRISSPAKPSSSADPHKHKSDPPTEAQRAIAELRRTLLGN